MENKGHPIIGNHYFARFMYEKWTGKKSAKTFGANIHKLEGAGVKPDVGKILCDIYGGQQRQDFHHLNKAIPTDYEQLRQIATEKINLLNKVESQVFEYKNTNKGLKFKYQKYWEIINGQANTYLRFNP